MKKFILIISPLIFLCLFLAKPSFAVDPAPTPVATDSSTLAQPGPNPGPPIGIPCGNTMCLEGESCVQYPGDNDQHCVPDSIKPEDKNASPNVPPDCWDMLGTNNGVFPPNGACWNHFTNTQTDVWSYQKTCIYQPVVHYEATRYLHSDNPLVEQPFELCGIGDSGPGGPAAPGGDNDACWIAMLVYTDVRDAEMGGYGPSPDAIASYSADFIAQNYLYNSLFGRPSDLNEVDPTLNAGGYSIKNREAYRTYWRMLPANNQANLRSFIMNMANEGKIENIHFDYTDTSGQAKKTDFKSLYNALSTQVTFFWHFPFVRLGCLTDYPVCPEYAQATRELKPVLQDLLNAAAQLNIPGANALINTYFTLASAFGGDLDGPYTAITPLDLSSLRGYIVKKKDEVEDSFYNKANYGNLLIDELNRPRYGTNKPKLTNVSRENLPYVGAIYQGLLSPKYGLLPAWQPQWIVDKYATPSGISDYKMGNLASDFPEVKIAKKNLLTRIADEAAAFISSPFGWLGTKLTGIFTDEGQLKGYNALRVDNTDEQVREVYDNPAFCPLPLSYHLIAPKTAADAPGTIPKPLDDHHQIVSISGNNLGWSYTPEHRPLYVYKCIKIRDPITHNIIGEDCGLHLDPCPSDDEHYDDGVSCFRRKWTVVGTKNGKGLNVLNNPKQTDIKETIAGNDQYSFFKMVLPAGASKITDASIDAPIARNFVSYLDGDGTTTATAPNGSSTMLNLAEPINRINNLAQDSMHILQNCWVVPGDLQNSPRCALAFPPEASSSACTGEAFKKITGEKYPPSTPGENYFKSFVYPKLTPEVITAYATAETETGVPCEVLAGIHFKEGDNNPDQDLQSGAPLGGRTLAESASQAAEELKGKAGGAITSMEQLIMALSYYNGGGNSNCQSGGSNSCAPTDRCGETVACTTDANACHCAGSPEAGSCRANCPSGFPYPLSYSFCPPASIGYDDPYVTNLWRSPAHDQMYILYMYDCTQTKPYVDERPGTLTVAISLFLSETK